MYEVGLFLPSKNGMVGAISSILLVFNQNILYLLFESTLWST